jgi:hypothetical protein
MLLQVCLTFRCGKKIVIMGLKFRRKTPKRRTKQEQSKNKKEKGNARENVDKLCELKLRPCFCRSTDFCYGKKNCNQARKRIEIKGHA